MEGSAARVGSVPQDRFTGSRVGDGDILQRLDQPSVLRTGHDREDERIDRVRTSGMHRSDREATPEVHDGRAIGQRDHIDHFVVEPRVAMDCASG
jgi:hypothetical protein